MMTHGLIDGRLLIECVTVCDGVCRCVSILAHDFRVIHIWISRLQYQNYFLQNSVSVTEISINAFTSSLRVERIFF